VTNYARFYTALGRIKYAGDREDFKKSVVWQYTLERTEHVSEMTHEEYDNCCAALEEMSGYKDELKKERSCCLRLMQQIGVDTSCWARVDNFCCHPRIAGKAFRGIRLEELRSLERKLRSIKRKGGLKTAHPSTMERRTDGGEGAAAPGGHVMVTYAFNMKEAAEC